MTMSVPILFRRVPGLLAGLLLTALPAAAQLAPGWSLVWSDEFAQPDGTKPDPAKWNYDIGGWGWGNNEIQYYTDHPRNARIVDGKLLIEAREQSVGGRNHTSARLLTKGKWDWTYGRFEARIKVPRGAGLWPACWMLGADIDAVGWPQCGEIDIMEHVGRLPKEVFGTIHGPGYAGGDSIGGTYTFGPDVADDFHVHAVEWEADEIRWYVDGIHYFTATPASLGGRQWVFDHPHFLLLNLAIDGNFAGPLDPSVPFPQQMWVDYVRVFAADGSGPGALQNAGFEAGALGPWTGYTAGGANAAGTYVESTSFTYYNGGNPGGDNVETRTGTYVGKIFGDFNGTENFNGCYQDLPALPGSEWVAEGWVLSHPQDLMTGANSAWLEVSFRDASGTVLALYRSPVLTAGAVVPGTWMRLEVTEQLDPVSFAPLGTVTSLVAPAGTSAVRYQTVFRQPGFDGGSLYLDDLVLRELVEAPPAATLDPPAFREGSVISWVAEGPDDTYQAEQSADGTTWSAAGPAFYGDLTTSLFVEEAGASYRVVRSGSGPSTVLPVTLEPSLLLTWSTEVGASYQVEQSTDLGLWTDTGPGIDGHGGEAALAVPFAEDGMFYRIRRTTGQ